MALQVGIVGLPNAGKTTLFRALTGAAATGRDNVGMAAVPDERLRQLAETVGAKKVTPASVRVVDVPGTGAELLGNLRQVDLVLAVLDGWSGTRAPDADKALELLAADRDHVQRRLERVAKQAKSGDAKLRAEVASLEQIAAHLEQLQAVSELGVEIPPELDLLTVKPLMVILKRARRDRPQARSRARRAARGGGRRVPRGRVRARCRRAPPRRDARPDHVLHRRRQGDTRVDAPQGECVRRGGDGPSDIARGFIRAEVIRWDDLVAAGSHSEARRQGKERVEGKTYVVEDGDVLNVRFNV